MRFLDRTAEWLLLRAADVIDLLHGKRALSLADLEASGLIHVVCGAPSPDDNLKCGRPLRHSGDHSAWLP